MPDAPAVSVVIATYNRDHLIGETLESVLNQSFQDFEVIVVDDGSTDNTREIVTRYAPRVQYVYQNNRGPSAARNLGVQRARAAWIAIQDSDDLCAANYLASLYGYAREHPGCGMVFANGAYLGESRHNRRTIIPPSQSRRLAAAGVRLDDLFNKSIVRLQAALISKTAYEAAGGHDESLRICMDLDLAFRLFMVASISYLDEVVFFYRKHEGNIGRNEELRLTENIQVVGKLLAGHPGAEKLLGGETVAQRLAYRYYRLAKSRWKKQQQESARQALSAAVTLSPHNLKYRLYHMAWSLVQR